MTKIKTILVCLLIGLLASACGTSTPQETPTSAPPPTSPPTATVAPTEAGIRLKADGSGDYATLEEAVAAASPGDTILLEAGTYRLAEPLKIEKPLRLVGAGMDQAEIVSDAEGFVVRFQGDGLFAAEDLTFRHEGEAEASVVLVEGGEVAFVRCRFTGAVYAGGHDVAGLVIKEDTTGTVRDCEAVENNGAGIYVAGQAQPTLEGNTCSNNELLGIAFFGDAGGVARENECSNNGRMGICVGEQAQPTLEENVCMDNAVAGIGYGLSLIHI
mgnify:CR=1 FL=1